MKVDNQNQQPSIEALTGSSIRSRLKARLGMTESDRQISLGMRNVP